MNEESSVEWEETSEGDEDSESGGVLHQYEDIYKLRFQLAVSFTYPASPVCSETVEERRQQEGDLRSCYFLPIFLSVAALLLVTVLTTVLLYLNFSQKELGKFIFQQ